MVARTAPLGSLKKGFKNSILPQIHQPMPLNRRESQQLLNSITSSFRRNLDKEHPWQHTDVAQPAASIITPDPSFTLAKNGPQKHRPTDRHLESILSNPLFAEPRTPVPQTSAAWQSHHNVFESAVARGMMTPKRAAGYLAAISKEIGLSAVDIPASMAASGAGLRVVQWLRASGHENNLEFLADVNLVPILTRFMFVEHLEEVAWTWLARLGAQLGKLPKDAQTQRSIALLLSSIKKAQEYITVTTDLTQGSLDSGYSAFLRANGTLPSEDPAVLHSLQGFWHTLSWSSTVNASKHGAPSAPLYEMFVDAGRPWKRHLDIAHLELHHPTSPDHISAVKYLHDRRIMESAERRKAQEVYVKRMASLGTDTIARLKEVGEKDEASWVSEFMARTFFAWNLKPTRERQTPLNLAI
ncbi:hypothetical protein JX265_010274 [Neoarthrinium moseri]|uniref:Uncharacterized protein n=1 Tax=Neoarthrinium moseri TaxID=1658444 RepID=A0A9P9WEX6_9PEZI|nr:hypothetical protein JX265_010274 [Neoarthrinium moseri]